MIIAESKSGIFSPSFKAFTQLSCWISLFRSCFKALSEDFEWKVSEHISSAWATERQKNEIEKKKLVVKEKEISSKKEIEELKAETALKVAKENKNKYDKK